MSPPSTPPPAQYLYQVSNVTSPDGSSSSEGAPRRVNDDRTPLKTPGAKKAYSRPLQPEAIRLQAKNLRGSEQIRQDEPASPHAPHDDHAADARSEAEVTEHDHELPPPRPSSKAARRSSKGSKKKRVVEEDNANEEDAEEPHSRVGTPILAASSMAAAARSLASPRSKDHSSENSAKNSNTTSPVSSRPATPPLITPQPLKKTTSHIHNIVNRSSGNLRVKDEYAGEYIEEDSAAAEESLSSSEIEASRKSPSEVPAKKPSKGSKEADKNRTSSKKH